jgi:hypothetical protein
MMENKARKVDQSSILRHLTNKLNFIKQQEEARERFSKCEGIR